MNESKITQLNKEFLYSIEKSKIEYILVKRFFDIIVSILGCILVIPIFICIKIAYLLNKDNAPILFKQERIGKNGKPIYIYKFKSMIQNADKVLDELMVENEKIRIEYKRYKKLKNDPRITKVGKFIRNTSLDEMPQFFNVLKGDMSVVGPRPYLFKEKQDMGEYYDKIITCKPGITGYWQVNGRSGTDFIKRLIMDEYYYFKKNIILDTKIFIKTFIKVSKKDGAN